MNNASQTCQDGSYYFEIATTVERKNEKLKWYRESLKM